MTWSTICHPIEAWEALGFGLFTGLLSASQSGQGWIWVGLYLGLCRSGTLLLMCSAHVHLDVGLWAFV
jgi:hypothetical protein